MHPKYFQRFSFFYTPEGDGAPAGGGGTPAPTPAPAAAPPAPPAAAAPSPTAGTGAPSGGNPPPPPAPTQYSYGEDRSNWIPQDRFSEVARERKQFKEDAERFRNMVNAAGIGANIAGRPEPVDPQIQRAREAIFEVLGPEMTQALQQLVQNRDRLGQMLERAPELLHSSERIWGAQAQRAVDTMLGEVAKDFGVQDLNPYQQKMYVKAFADYVASSPQLTDRYERQDPKVITEFLTELRTNTFDPLRRRAQTPAPGGFTPRVPGQPRLPAAPRGSGVIPQGAPAPTPRTEDEIHDAAAATFFASVGGARR